MEKNFEKHIEDLEKRVAELEGQIPERQKFVPEDSEQGKCYDTERTSN